MSMSEDIRRAIGAERCEFGRAALLIRLSPTGMAKIMHENRLGEAGGPLNEQAETLFGVRYELAPLTDKEWTVHAV